MNTNQIYDVLQDALQSDDLDTAKENINIALALLKDTSQDKNITFIHNNQRVTIYNPLITNIEAQTTLDNYSDGVLTPPPYKQEIKITCQTNAMSYFALDRTDSLD